MKTGRRRMGALAWLACSRASVALRLEPCCEKSRTGQGEGWRPPGLRCSGEVPPGNSEPAVSPLTSWAPQPPPGLAVLHRCPCKTGPTLRLARCPPPSSWHPAIHTQPVFTAFLESGVLNGASSPRKDKDWRGYRHSLGEPRGIPLTQPSGGTLRSAAGAGPTEGLARGAPWGRDTPGEETPPPGRLSPKRPLRSPAARVSLPLASILPSWPPPVSGIPCAPWEPSHRQILTLSEPVSLCSFCDQILLYLPKDRLGSNF